MNIDELKKILDNKLANLELNKIAAITIGQIESLIIIEKDISDTKEILNKLI